MNQHRFAILGILLVLIFSTSSVQAFVFSPVIPINTTIDEDTLSFFFGEGNIQGQIYGYNYSVPTDLIPNDYLEIYSEYISEQNLSIPEFLNTLPLLGANILPHIDQLTLLNMDKIKQLDPHSLPLIDPKDLYEEFSNIDIIIEQGITLFLTPHQPIRFNQSADFGVYGFTEFSVIHDESFYCCLSLSEHPIIYDYHGPSAYLMPYQQNRITIQDSSNQQILWTGSGEDWLFIFSDETIQITDSAPLHLLPLDIEPDIIQPHPWINLSISPANIEDIHLESLLHQLEETTKNITDTSLSILPQNESEITSFLHIIPSVLNGGFIVYNTSDTIYINQNDHHFSTLGFGRGGSYEVNYNQQNTISPHQVSINGSFHLVFLGNHFYSSTSANDPNGIAIPLLAIIAWSIALVIYLLFTFILKKPPSNEEKSITIKPFDLLFLVGSMIIVFILMDLEISTQFGTSFISILFTQGLSLALLLFIGIQFFLWGIGYVSCAFPIAYICNTLLRYFGINERKKRIGKGIGLFFIWLFTALYVTLLLNILLLFIDLPGLLSSLG